MSNILVTGGAGYIGSHTCKALAAAGHTPITVDDLSRGHRSSVIWGPLERLSLNETDRLTEILKRHQVEAVIHFAAFAYVGESNEFPQMYFENNVKGSLSLLVAMRAAKVKKLIFSSSCATYGKAMSPSIDEDHPQNPINPYGLTKLMVEKLLINECADHGLSFSALRYFNGAGADPALEIGERHDPEPHIIPNIIRAGLYQSPLTLNGQNYPTEDGTCVRDFVHVSDLAQAHCLALDALLENKSVSPFYNLGNSRGHSLLELVKVTEKIMDRPIHFTWGPKRQGDPAYLVGSPAKFEKDFAWKRTNSEIETIIKTAVDWERKMKKDA